MKGQASMIAIVIALVMVIFIMIFLFTSTLSSTEGQALKSEYRDLYANSMLLSLLSTDIKDCGTFSDMLKGETVLAGRMCSKDFDEVLNGFMKELLNATGNTDYDWLLEAAPKNYQGITYQWGNPAVTSTPGYWDARTLITAGTKQLEIKLYIRTK